MRLQWASAGAIKSAVAYAALADTVPVPVSVRSTVREADSKQSSRPACKHGLRAAELLIPMKSPTLFYQKFLYIIPYIPRSLPDTPQERQGSATDIAYQTNPYQEEEPLQYPWCCRSEPPGQPQHINLI